MSDDPRNSGTTDPAVSSAYRSLATETAPEALERRIVDHAAQAVRTDPHTARRDRRYRLLAMAATVVLSLALLVDFVLRAPERAADGPPTVVSDDALAGSARSIETQVGTATEAAKAASSATGPAAESSQPASATATTDVSIIAPPITCSDEQRQSAAEWWSCVRDLERNGQSATAARELQALLEAFPRFSIPEDATHE